MFETLVYKNGLMTSLFAAMLVACGLAGTGRSQVVSDDFESDTPGSNPSQPSFVVEPGSDTEVSVVDGSTTPPDPFGAGNQSLRFLDTTTTETTSVGYQFDPLESGVASVDFYLQKDSVLTSPYGFLNFANDSTASDGPTLDELGLRMILDGRPANPALTAVERNENGSSSFVATNADFDFNSPHSLRIHFDAASSTYTATLDGLPVSTADGSRSNFNFFGPQTHINQMSLGTSTGFENIQLFFDNIAVEMPHMPGDADGSGVVDIDDYLLIQANSFTSAPLGLKGDVNYNGFVDFDDFQQWKVNFPGGVEAAEAAIASLGVPEPAAVLLGGVGFGLVLCVHQRRKRH